MSEYYANSRAHRIAAIVILVGAGLAVLYYIGAWVAAVYARP